MYYEIEENNTLFSTQTQQQFNVSPDCLFNKYIGNLKRTKGNQKTNIILTLIGQVEFNPVNQQGPWELGFCDSILSVHHILRTLYRFKNVHNGSPFDFVAELYLVWKFFHWCIIEMVELNNRNYAVKKLVLVETSCNISLPAF